MSIAYHIHDYGQTKSRQSRPKGAYKLNDEELPKTTGRQNLDLAPALMTRSNQFTPINTDEKSTDLTKNPIDGSGPLWRIFSLKFYINRL